LTTLADDMKAVILTRSVATAVRPVFRSPRPPGNFPAGHPSPRPPRPTGAHYHEIEACEYILAQLHKIENDDGPNDTGTEDSTTLLSYATKRQEVSPADLRRVTASTVARPSEQSGRNEEITIDGQRYRQCNTHEYLVSSYPPQLEIWITRRSRSQRRNRRERRENHQPNQQECQCSRN
jgi:hypothetical protein